MKGGGGGSKLMRCITHILLKILSEVQESDHEHAITLHESDISEHEERQISIPETSKLDS